MSAQLMKNIKDRQKPNDRIYTPPAVVDIMLKYVEEGETTLDPCRGQGAFHNKLEGDWCEIDEGKDFFEYNSKVDTIIGNPPYSILSKWLDHSYTIAQKKIIYVIGMYSLTPIRLERASNKGFNLTHLILTKIPSWFQRSYVIVLEKIPNKSR